ncbi:MAG: polyprenyl synthetase family protein [Fimbriimonadaceae bacterium]|nr:polyprenyl synthetase family protein [Fimbriimonadaceae bacterium]
MAIVDVRAGNSPPRAQAVIGARPQGTNGDAEALFPQIHADLRQVETRLRQAVHANVPVVPEVFLHTVHAGGKRVRPALALLAAQLCGRCDEAAFDVAVAVELIHLASLIHDDVVDDSVRRRARLTANRVWGNKTAVLVADFVHSLAYPILSRCGDVALVRRLSETVVQMVEGELAQMFNEGSLEVTEPHYFQMIGDKTASLMALACELGAMVGGGSSAQIAALRDYGFKVGLAFQIADDLLDLTGDEERIGKPVGNDLRCGRLTLPLLHVLHNGNAAAKEELLPLICRGDLEVADIQRIRALLDRAGALQHAAEYARGLSSAAAELLADFPDNEARQALEALAAYIVLRTT